jgi:hypothetical protein
MSPQSHSDKHTQFQCEQYSPVSVYDRHCKFYRNGNCGKTGQRCAEWLRKNPLPPPEPVDAEPADADLFGCPISNPKFKAGKTPSSSEKKSLPRHRSSFSPTKPLTGFSSELVESFKRLQTEIHFTSETGEFWLVPEYRDPSRGEITPEHLALICNVLTAFPGAAVTAFKKILPPKKENNDA